MEQEQRQHVDFSTRRIGQQASSQAELRFYSWKAFNGGVYGCKGTMEKSMLSVAHHNTSLCLAVPFLPKMTLLHLKQWKDFKARDKI